MHLKSLQKFEAHDANGAVVGDKDTVVSCMLIHRHCLLQHVFFKTSRCFRLSLCPRTNLLDLCLATRSQFAQLVDLYCVKKKIHYLVADYVEKHHSQLKFLQAATYLYGSGSCTRYMGFRETSFPRRVLLASLWKNQGVINRIRSSSTRLTRTSDVSDVFMIWVTRLLLEFL